MMPGQSFWTVGCVISGQEFKLRDRLAGTGEEPPWVVGGPEPYVPVRRQKVWVRRCRHKVETIVPVFRRYVFLKVKYGFERLIERTMVRFYPLRDGYGQPIILREADIEGIRSREDAGEFNERAVELDFSTGTPIIVTGGAFEQQRGTVTKAPRLGDTSCQININHLRAKIPLDFLKTV